MKRSGRPRPGPVRGSLTGLLALLALLAACGEGVATFPTEVRPEARVTQLAFVAGNDQTMLGGRRSPEPFRVRTLGATGEPVAGAVVQFTLTGKGGGILSQPRALTDSTGEAATYLLHARSGIATLTAVSGRAAAGLDVEVGRAPGALEFEPSTGAVGLPGKVHPDSVVRVRVLDTEAVAMRGVQVYFAGPPGISRFVDTTDAQGWASTVVRRSSMSAGEGRVIAFILDFPEVTASTPRPVEAAARRVILISVDGLRADAIERYHPPNLARLATEGAFTDRARTVVPSLTAPAHLSLFSSVTPERHGIYGDEIEYTQAMAELDPLFRNGSRRGVRTRAFVARDGPLETLETALQCKLAFGLDSLSLVEPAAGEIAGAALPTLADPDVGMVFVHIPDPDVAGHAHGWESPEYGQAVLRADAAVGALAEALGPGALLIVTSDHGGGGAFGSHQHGSSSDEDVLIPLILWGDRVVPGSDAGEASILDVAPTVLWSLGFAPPGGYQGRPLLAVFR